MNWEGGGEGGQVFTPSKIGGGRSFAMLKEDRHNNF